MSRTIDWRPCFEFVGSCTSSRQARSRSWPGTQLVAPARSGGSLPARSQGASVIGSVGCLKRSSGSGATSTSSSALASSGRPCPWPSCRRSRHLASTYGAGLRLRRPHDLRSFGGASPWLEAEGLDVHAGQLQGAGFAVGAGIAVPIGPARKVWLGPFVRYLDILQPDSRQPGRPGTEDALHRRDPRDRAEPLSPRWSRRLHGFEAIAPMKGRKTRSYAPTFRAARFRRSGHSS